jgi:hypothetical protein
MSMFTELEGVHYELRLFKKHRFSERFILYFVKMQNLLFCHVLILVLVNQEKHLSI